MINKKCTGNHNDPVVKDLRKTICTSSKFTNKPFQNQAVRNKIINYDN